MTERTSPPARRVSRPRWLDLRLIIGVLLVLTSVVVGARVVASSHETIEVWGVRSDLARGAVLTTDELVPRRVRLFDALESYLPVAGRPPVGHTLARSLNGGELLPLGAILDPGHADPARLVTIPVSALHAPDEWRPGSLVDVFATFGSRAQGSRTVPILRQAVVVGEIDEGGGLAGGGERGMVLRVAPERVAEVVAAVRVAEIDVVLLTGQGDPGDVGTEAVVIDPTGSGSRPGTGVGPVVGSGSGAASGSALGGEPGTGPR